MGARMHVFRWHLLSELLHAMGQPKLVQQRLEYIALRHMNADITTADIEAGVHNNADSFFWRRLDSRFFCDSVA